MTKLQASPSLCFENCNFHSLLRRLRDLSDQSFAVLNRTGFSTTVKFLLSLFMETMNELAGYLSSDQDRTMNSPMQDSSSEDESLPSSSGNKAKANTVASVANLLPAVSLKKYDFIPMRLTETERKYLQVLENALEVCEYTDVVDVTFSHTKKSKLSRILESLVDVLSISCGLLVSSKVTFVT